jgi:2-aminoethylphosphonate-pyruvate transaminase
VDSFRIGHIGRFDAAVVAEMVAAVREAVAEMGVTSCAPPAEALAERARLS